MISAWVERLRPHRFFFVSGMVFLVVLTISRGMAGAGAYGRMAIAAVCFLLGIVGVVSTILAAKHAFSSPEGEINAALVIVLVAVLAVLHLSAILVGVVTVVEQLAQP